MQGCRQPPTPVTAAGSRGARHTSSTTRRGAAGRGRGNARIAPPDQGRRVPHNQLGSDDPATPKSTIPNTRAWQLRAHATRPAAGHSSETLDVRKRAGLGRAELKKYAQHLSANKALYVHKTGRYMLLAIVQTCRLSPIDDLPGSHIRLCSEGDPMSPRTTVAGFSGDNLKLSSLPWTACRVAGRDYSHTAPASLVPHGVTSSPPPRRVTMKIPTPYTETLSITDIFGRFQQLPSCWYQL